jgi:hypothetical protein
MRMKKEWKVGKFMKGTLPSHVAGRTVPRRVAQPKTEEEEQQPTLRKKQGSSSADRMLDLALKALRDCDCDKARLYINTARNILNQKGL